MDEENELKYNKIYTDLFVEIMELWKVKSGV
jgi:hypothetical protein